MIIIIMGPVAKPRKDIKYFDNHQLQPSLHKVNLRLGQ